VNELITPQRTTQSYRQRYFSGIQNTFSHVPVAIGKVFVQQKQDNGKEVNVKTIADEDNSFSKQIEIN
jgi:hypothetical protein